MIINRRNNKMQAFPNVSGITTQGLRSDGFEKTRQIRSYICDWRSLKTSAISLI